MPRSKYKAGYKTYIRHGNSNKDELTPSHPRVVAIKYCQEYIKFKLICGAEREVKKMITGEQSSIYLLEYNSCDCLDRQKPESFCDDDSAMLGRTVDLA